MTRIIYAGGYAEVKARSREEVEKIMLETAAMELELFDVKTMLSWRNGPLGGSVDIFEYKPSHWRIFGWEAPILDMPEDDLIQTLCTVKSFRIPGYDIEFILCGFLSGCRHKEVPQAITHP